MNQGMWAASRKGKGERNGFSSKSREEHRTVPVFLPTPEFSPESWVKLLTH